ncbi:MAG TPA: rhodanese-like domain-containing protein [Anaerolineales bacterium]|nr:rhodanese-like domain-containing protein [Anaerolineales bacterium]
MSKTKALIAISILIFTMLACNALAPTPTPIPFKPLPTPLHELDVNSDPLTEDEVTRVTVEEAKTAFDNGTAIFVDVRSEQSFAISHIPGALNIQLGEFETNPTELNLPTDHWIITYCT